LLLSSIVVLPAGVEGTGEIGTATVSATAVVSVTGVSLRNSATVAANANVFAVGVSAIGYIGFVTIWGRIVPNPNTVYTDVNPTPGTVWSDIEPSTGTE
jgi:hypothetical protein